MTVVSQTRIESRDFEVEEGLGGAQGLLGTKLVPSRFGNISTGQVVHIACELEMQYAAPS